MCRNAPHIIITHGKKSDRAVPVASTIALTYLELAAPSMGIGACWPGFFNAAALSWPPLCKLLSLPDGHLCFGAMLVGYAKYKYYRMPGRREPVVTWFG